MKKETTFQQSHPKEFQQIFPQGEKLTEEFSKYFIGQAYLATISNNEILGTHISNVTFEPGCRNNWHSHTGGQLLIVTAGRGYYQEKGQSARELRSGDVVEISPDIIHWHGAAPDSWFSHLAIECNPHTNQNSWFEEVNDIQYKDATDNSKAFGNYHAWVPNYASALKSTDPELVEILDNFTFNEVFQHGELDTKTKIMVIMASTIAQNTINEYRVILQAAFDNHINPIEIKEILYQAIPYVGIARITDFINVANQFLHEKGIKLPLENQTTGSPEDRFEKGLTLQKEIFGKQIDKMYENTPKNQIHIQRYLSANCFGDYQTRTGLDIPIRELLTFSILVSFGGCESQVKSHIQGNMNVGNDKNKLLAVVTQLLPYIGYPRTLNAINCINEVIPENN